MSGLDVEREVIIEVGAIITDLDFNELDRYHSVVKQDQKYIDGMDEWNTEHHGKSGLIAQIPNGKEPDIVEKELCELADKHFSKEDPAVIAGNSIHQDKAFLQKHFKNFHDKLHYRMLDVSSWKLISKFKYNYEYKKNGAHRAVDDIEESIAELKAYIDFFQNRK